MRLLYSLELDPSKSRNVSRRYPETGQIVRVSDYTTYGVSGTVVQIDDKTIQLNTPSGILATDYATVPVEIGDHVIMDSTNHVIIKKINQTSKFAFKTNAVLTWDDIGACEDAKKAIIAALETPYVKKDIFKYFHKKEVKGALLWVAQGTVKRSSERPQVPWLVCTAKNQWNPDLFTLRAGDFR